MLDLGDRDYYEKRAEAELKLAENAVHPTVCRAHYQLASYYLDRLYGVDARSTGTEMIGVSNLLDRIARH